MLHRPENSHSSSNCTTISPNLRNSAENVRFEYWLQCSCILWRIRLEIGSLATTVISASLYNEQFSCRDEKDRIDKMPIWCLPTQWMPYRLLLFILLIWLHAVEKPFIDCFESLLRIARTMLPTNLIWISLKLCCIRSWETIRAENWEAHAQNELESCIAIINILIPMQSTRTFTHTHTMFESRRDHGRSVSVGLEQTNNQHYFK